MFLGLSRGLHAEVPAATGYQGVLLDETGAPRDFPADVVVRIWSLPFSTDPADLLYQETHTGVEVVAGLFALAIGSGAASVGVYDAQLFSGPERWLELEVDGESLEPRQRFYATPYALRSAESDDSQALQGLTPDEIVASARSGLQFSDLQGVVTEAQVAPSIALDSEVVQIVIEGGGMGSNLDADRLDGLDAASFLQLDQSADFSGTTLRMLEGTTLEVSGLLSVGSAGIDFRDGEERFGYDPALNRFTLTSVVEAEAFRYEIPVFQYEHVPAALFTARLDSLWDRTGQAGYPAYDGTTTDTFAPIHFHATTAFVSEFICTYRDGDTSAGANLSFEAELWEATFDPPGSSVLATIQVTTTDAVSAGYYTAKVNVVPPYEVRLEQAHYWIQLQMTNFDVVPNGGLGLRTLTGCRVGYVVAEP